MTGKAECLTFKQVSGSDILRRDFASFLHNAVAWFAKFYPFKWLVDWWIERHIAGVLTRKENTKKIFYFPLPFALGALDLNLQVSGAALDERLHDWVRCKGVTQYSGSYFLGTGEWGDLTTPAAKQVIMREAVMLHRAKLEYKKTDLYTGFVQSAQEGKPFSRNQVVLDSVEKIDDYFERFVALFRSIQAHGVLPLSSVREARPASFRPSLSRRRKTEWGERDIGVAIDPDGRLLLLPGGKHRWSIAAVLKLARVPVQVRMIHVDWLRQLPRREGQSWIEVINEGIEQVRQRYHPREGSGAAAGPK